MHAANRLFTTMISILLIGGLVCARICDMSCAFTGCKNPHTAAVGATKSEAQIPPSEHCHQNEGEKEPVNSHSPTPFDPDHSSKCQIHSDSTTVGIAVKAKAQHSIKIPAAEVYHGMSVSFDQLAGNINLLQVFRPPPTCGVSPVLRI
jgi:hypothetical protein